MSDETPKEISGTPYYKIALSVANGEVGEFVYCLQDSRYYLYENGFWKEILELKFLSRIQEGVVRETKVKSGDGFITQKGKILTKYSSSQKKAVLDNFKIIKFKELEDFNATPVINLENCMFDPIGMNVLAHNKDFYSTMRVPYKYVSLSECPLWVKTLEEIFEGDREKIETLQEFFGYCLTPKNNQKKALLLLGESDSGKSTILFILRKMLGESNCSSVSLKNLGNAVFLMGVMNKMVNIDSDVSKDAQSYEAEFKMITSNEPIHCNPKYIAPFDFIPSCKMVMAANIFPKITDHSSAFFNRLILIPFDRIFLPHEQDKDLWPKLETELPGILNWAIDGLKRLTKRGYFEHYSFIKEAVKDLEDDNNPSNRFFEEHLIFENGSYEEKNKLFDKYSNWCNSTNTYRLSNILFGKCILKKFPRIEKSSRLPGNGPYIWRNLKYVEFKHSEPEIDKDKEIQWQT